MTRADARCSTYSGAPSLQPSLAPTLETTSYPSSQLNSSRFSEQTLFTTHIIAEKGVRPPIYGACHASGAASSLTLSPTDPLTADIRSFADVLDRMNDARTDKQRFVMSSNKTEEVSKIALGAKVERALSLRMSGQDAVLRPKKPLDEKHALEVPAN